MTIEKVSQKKPVKQVRLVSQVPARNELVNSRETRDTGKISESSATSGMSKSNATSETFEKSESIGTSETSESRETSEKVR